MCMATYCVSSNLCYFPMSRSRGGEGRVGGLLQSGRREGGRDEREGWAGVGGWLGE